MNLLNLFRNADKVREVDKDMVISEEGAPSDVMYVLLDGEVEVRSGDAVLRALEPGDILGEMALIDSAPRSATAVAKTSCRLAEVGPTRFQFMIQQTPFFAIHVMQVLAKRLRENHS